MIHFISGLKLHRIKLLISVEVFLPFSSSVSRGSLDNKFRLNV